MTDGLLVQFLESEAEATADARPAASAAAARPSDPSPFASGVLQPPPSAVARPGAPAAPGRGGSLGAFGGRASAVQGQPLHAAPASAARPGAAVSVLFSPPATVPLSRQAAAALLNQPFRPPASIPVQLLSLFRQPATAPPRARLSLPQAEEELSELKETLADYRDWNECDEEWRYNFELDKSEDELEEMAEREAFLVELIEQLAEEGEAQPGGKENTPKRARRQAGK